MDTGALRDSITITFLQEGASWRVGPSIFYSLYVEYGTGEGDPARTGTC